MQPSVHQIVYSCDVDPWSENGYVLRNDAKVYMITEDFDNETTVLS